MDDEFIYSIGEALMTEDEVLDLHYPQTDKPGYFFVTLKNGTQLKMSVTVERVAALSC